MSKLRISSGKQYLHKQILSCRLTSSLMFARWHSIHSKVTSIYKTMTWCRYLLISTCIQSTVLKLLNIKETDSSISMLICAPLYLVPSLITTPLNFICWHKIIAPYNFSAAAPTHCSQTLRWRSWSLLADAWQAEYYWHWLAPLTATLFKLLLLMTGLLFPLQGITRNLDNQLLNMGHLHLSSSSLSLLSNRIWPRM